MSADLTLQQALENEKELKAKVNLLSKELSVVTDQYNEAKDVTRTLFMANMARAYDNDNEDIRRTLISAIDDLDVLEDESDDMVSCPFEGIDYMRNISDGIVYTDECDEVGTWCTTSNKINFNIEGVYRHIIKHLPNGCNLKHRDHKNDPHYDFMFNKKHIGIRIDDKSGGVYLSSYAEGCWVRGEFTPLHLERFIPLVKSLPSAWVIQTTGRGSKSQYLPPRALDFNNVSIPDVVTYINQFIAIM
mgnify:CR=1 FL=1